MEGNENKGKNRRNPSSADSSTPSSADGNLEWFCNLATVHSVSMNMDEQSLQCDDLDCSGCISRRCGTATSYACFIFSFWMVVVVVLVLFSFVLRNLHADFYSFSTSLYSHQQCKSFSYLVGGFLFVCFFQCYPL